MNCVLVYLIFKCIYSCVLKCVPVLCQVFFYEAKTSILYSYILKELTNLKRIYMLALKYYGLNRNNEFWHSSKINSDIYRNIQFIFLSSQFRKFSTKSHKFKVCNNASLLINYGLWNCLITKTQKKIESDLITILILLQHLQPLHIVMKSWMKTLTSLVKIINYRDTF